MTDMLEATVQHVQEWFENQDGYLVSDRVRSLNEFRIIDITKHKYSVIQVFIRHHGADCITVYSTGLYGATHYITYELADPEFPQNMLQRIEKIIQEDITRYENYHPRVNYPTNLRNKT